MKAAPMNTATAATAAPTTNKNTAPFSATNAILSVPDTHSTQTVLVIAGPTAVGKTAVAIAAAEALGTAVVSADSRQCYQGMAIGTAQPGPDELARVPHYFINTFPPEHNITAAVYEQLALGYLEEIFHGHNTAVVCGGTGLYIKALCEGLDEMPSVDEQISAFLLQEYRDKGLDWLQQRVREEDPDFYQQGEIHNPMRLIRALSFVRSTGDSILQYRSGVHKERPFRTVKVCLELPREQLYHRINQRVDQMMEEGLLEEVRQLFPLRHLKNLQTVGYSELFAYLEGKSSLAEAVDKIKQHTRNYAKRQLTWFRKDPECHWFQADAPDLLSNILHLVNS